MRSKFFTFFITLWLIACGNVLQAQQLKVFPPIPNRAVSDQYVCNVQQVGSSNWQSAFVVQTKCKVNPKPNSTIKGPTEDNGYFENLPNWSASYIAFEFENTTVKVEIAKKDGSAITKAVVRPEGEATVTLSNGKAYVTLTKNTNVNVDINGQMENNYTGQDYSGPAVHTISIFANPIYVAPTGTNVVELQPGQDIRSLNRDNWDAIIFAPGIHNIGKEFEIKTGETLYIPGDAIVKGTIHPANVWGSDVAKNWKIYGSGAISGEDIDWLGDDVTANKVFTYRSEGANLKGFVVLDPANHTFNMAHAGLESNINIYENIKIFGWRKNADGINAFSNSKISNCFIRTQDDDFYLGDNVKIENNTVWNDANGSVLYLTKGNANSYFKNIKVIYHRAKWHYWGGGRVISMRDLEPKDPSVGEHVNISNVLIQNVKIEDPFPAFGPFYGSMKPGTGSFTFSNVVIENVYQAAPCVGTYSSNQAIQPFNALKGLDSERKFKNITFKNCYYNGKYLRSFADGDFVTNQYIENVNFVVDGNPSTYTVSASAGANGSISPNGSVTVNSGGNQTFSITPNTGYQVDVVTVDGVNKGAITSYTFTNVTAIHTISATFKVASSTISAFSQIEAESYSSMSGVQAETCNEGGQNIGFIENGDYIVFNNVNFGTGAASFEARVASESSGGTIEVRLDGLSGQLVGTCAVTGTGGFQTWTTKTCAISGASGTHNLYLKFTGGTGFLFNLNWLKFIAGGTTSYTIAASDGPNGEINPDGNIVVNSGGNQIFTITPFSGYQVDVVTVDGVNMGAITSYAFNNVTANHTISATFKVASSTIDAFSQIEAESYSSMSGVQAETCNEGGQNIGFIENGDYIVFNNVNFGTGAASFEARVASETSGGSIEVRLDGIAGQLVGTCAVTGTGGFQTWTTKTCAISGASGTHNLYLKFTGGTGFLFNLNWLKFITSSLPNVTALTPWTSGTNLNRVEGNNRLLTVMVMGESNVNFSASGVKYGNQDMTKQSEKLYYVGGNRTYASIFTLNETGVSAAANGTIAVSWLPTTSPSVGSSIYSVLLGNVDQTTPVGATANNGLTETTVTTNALSTASGDMIIMAGATENDGSITFNNGFTESFESTGLNWGDACGGYKMGNGANETPSFTQSARMRLALCAIVVKKATALKSASIGSSFGGNSTGNNVKVYPNPVSKTLYINHADAQSVNHVKIFNLHGQLLYNKQATGSTTEVDVNELNCNGLLIVQVASGQTISTFKVSVAK